MKKSIFAILAIAFIATFAITSCNSSDKNKATDSDSVDVEVVEVVNETELGSNDILDLSTPIPMPMVIDFWATWCPPCRKFKPIFNNLAEKYNGQVKFISIDVDKAPQLAEQYEVASIPTILYVATDGTVNRHVGFMDIAEAEAAIKAILPKQQTENTSAPQPR